MFIAEKVSIAVPPSTVYTIYTEVDKWNRWDPDTRSASLNGPFKVGARVRLGLPVTMQSLKRYAEQRHNAAA